MGHRIPNRDMSCLGPKPILQTALISAWEDYHSPWPRPVQGLPKWDDRAEIRLYSENPAQQGGQ